MAEDYWPISKIGFSKKQMLWLIYHLDELKNGVWPQRPGTYVEAPRMACKEAKLKEWGGLCVNCPFNPCLNPSAKTPLRIRKERYMNRTLEIASEVEARIDLVIDYISGWYRPTKNIYKNDRKNLPRGRG
jgi:hypothetical protein